MRYFLHIKPFSPKTFVLIAVILSLPLLACRPQTSTSDEATVVWEAWDHISSSYVGADKLDSVDVTRRVIMNMLVVADQPAYPFLTDLGRLDTRAPSYVPEDLTDVWRAWELVRQRWPEIEPSVLGDAGVDGLVESLGENTAVHLTPEGYERAQESLRGSYEGIGAFIGLEDDKIVVDPMPNSPAERAGLLAGDVLMAVDGENTEGRSFQEVVEPVRGPAGTMVALLVERQGEEEPLEFSVIRGDIDLVSVGRSLLPGAIGNIFISDFRDNTPDEFLNVVEELKQVDMLALILDLRSNPGASIEAAKTIANELLPGGLFMYEIGKDGARKDWPVEGSGLVGEDIDMVVLVNEFTGSAAEALAGALQDAGRAKILGISTIGDGSANEFRMLSDGSALYFPVSHWYTPSGKQINGSGITPDIEVELTAEDRVRGRDAQLTEAYEILNDQLPHFR